jgi:hypothetical protein
MKIERITMLVTAKTYPTISSRYNETVCTAGITTDGLFRRIYPICYRSLPKSEKFCKYQWISCDAIRDTRDPRDESYKLIGKIKPLDVITTRQEWRQRRKLMLPNVQSNMQQIIKAAYDTKRWKSLFMFKPAKIIKFNVIDCSSSEKINRKKEILLHSLNIGESLVEDIPYKFSYTFIDSFGKISTLQLLDWEIYQLTRKLIRVHKNNFSAIGSALKNKYFDDIACKRDVYFFLGSNRYWHIRKSKNPFMIIGLFYPPKLEI